jgi:hypothetical protein
MNKKIIAAFIILFSAVISLCVYTADSWHTYRQEDPPITFDYPKSFGQPEVYSDITKSQWEVSFRRADSGFQINNGFHHIWSEGATLEKYLAHYQAQVDMDANDFHREIKDYKIEHMKVGDFPAVKVKWHGFNFAVTDIFIYQDTTNTSNVIMIQVGEDFVDDQTLEKIVQSLQITSNSFLQHQLLVVPDGVEPSLAASMAMTGELLTSTVTDPLFAPVGKTIENPLTHIGTLKTPEGSYLGDINVTYIDDKKDVFSTLYVVKNVAGQKTILYQIDSNGFSNTMGLDFDMNNAAHFASPWGFEFAKVFDDHFVLHLRTYDRKNVSDDWTISWNNNKKVFEIYRLQFD